MPRSRPDPEPKAVRQRVVVVVGAGRSGTSAVTRAVQALGVALGDDLKRGRGKNPTGFFEDRALLALNKRLRRIIGVRADSVGLIDDAQWQRPEVSALADVAVRTITRRFGQYEVWGYKYGRTLRLLPFWEEVFRRLDVDVSYVLALRNPLSVARSRAALDARRGRQAHSDLEWLVGVVPYFRRLCLRPFVVVDYDLLVTDPERQLGRMAAALTLPVTDEVRRGIENYADSFLRAGLRHSRFSEADLDHDARVNRIARDAYRLLSRLARDEWTPDTPEFRDEWQQVEDAVAALASVLAHVDRVEAERRLARLHPLGPLQALPGLLRRLWP